MAPHLRKPVATGRVQAPLQDVALHDDGPWDLSLLLALGGRADVDQQAAVIDHGGGLVGIQPPEPGPGLVEELVDGAGHLAAPSSPAAAGLAAPANPKCMGKPGGE